MLPGWILFSIQLVQHPGPQKLQESCSAWAWYPVGQIVYMCSTAWWGIKRKGPGFGFLCSFMFLGLLTHIVTLLALTFSPAALSQCALHRLLEKLVSLLQVRCLMTASHCSREIIWGLSVVCFLCPHSNKFFPLIGKKISLLSPILNLLLFNFVVIFHVPGLVKMERRSSWSAIWVPVSLAYSFTMFPFTQVLLRCFKSMAISWCMILICIFSCTIFNTKWDSSWRHKQAFSWPPIPSGTHELRKFFVCLCKNMGREKKFWLWMTITWFCVELQLRWKTFEAGMVLIN